MLILFEEHQYEPALIEDIFRELANVEQDLITKKVSLGWVGYFYCQAEEDCVFILPKVLLKDEERVIDGKKKKIDVIAGIEYEEEDGNIRSVTPEEIITPEGQNKYLSKEYRKFIYEFSVWVYRSINMYRKQVKDQTSIYYKPLPTEGKGRKHEARTMLDVILSLMRFNVENQNFFMFTIKNIHSGMNKINWTRTISRNQAYLQGGTPIYLNPVNKKRQINFDEELFIIFFSILNYLNEHYGFKTPINCQYDLITGNRFDAYKKGLGRKKLLAIKYKYFSDKAIELWNLCMTFFDSTHVINVNTAQQDFLLAKSFEHVFEAMIDDLIGTPRKDIPKGLADQDDNKKVDHLYTYKSLISTDDSINDDIYYIGDSKYYKSGHTLGKESVAKQYTYARNVIQWNIDLFMNPILPNWTDEDKEAYNEDKAKFGKIKIRKDEDEGNITEGYNIIPNFFLSAFVSDDRQYDDHHNNIRLHYKGNSTSEHSTYIKCQFENRLFDRDTLILSHYDVNFLYVLYLYARNKNAEKSAWRSKVRDIFRNEIRVVLMDKFDFYAMTPHEGDGFDVGKEFIKRNFQRVVGKIYTPYNDNRYYALALIKSDDEKVIAENKAIKDELGKYFYITDKTLPLGKDPKKALSKIIETTNVKIHRKRKQGILVGIIPDNAHWNWILQEKKYNIRKETKFLRPGTKALTRDALLVNSVVLYEDINGEPVVKGLYELLDYQQLPTIYTYDEMKNFINPEYPFSKNQNEDERKKNEYIVYEIDAENMRELTDADKKEYVRLIKENGKDKNGRLGVPFII